MVDVEGKLDPRTIWKLFKELGINCNGNGCENNFGIKCDTNMITYKSDLAEIFNNYFVNIDSKLKEPFINIEFKRLNNFVQSKVPSDIEFKVSLSKTGFVRNVLSNLK